MPAMIVPASVPDEATGWTKDDWNTPERILAPTRVLAGGRIGLDPCSNPTSLVRSFVAWTRADDALSRSWVGHGLVFVNPPYSKGLLTLFAEKIGDEAIAGAEIVALVPANVEVAVWHDVFWQADAICFPRSRIRFLVDGKPKGTPLLGSGIPYFGPRPEAFRAAFSDLGRVVVRGMF
jgi:ParB family chromosome partitioning protein